MNYNITDTTIAEPCASSMILTFRAIGYNLEAAVADIIDNSISANAKNIWFNSEWQGGNSFITILDDGCGMNHEELGRERNRKRTGGDCHLEGQRQER